MLVNLNKLATTIRLVNTTFKQYKWKFFAVTILGFLSGLSGAVGIGAIIPLFSLLTDQETGLDIISRSIDKLFALFNLTLTLPVLVIFIATLFILKALIKFAAQYMNELLAAEYEENLRSSLFHKTFQSNWPFLMEQKIGYLERVLMFDVYISSSTITQMSGLILLATSFVTYAVVAFSISTFITLLTIAFGLVLFFVFKPFLYKIQRLTEESAAKEKMVSHHINQNITGAKMIKAQAVENMVFQKGKEYFQRFKEIRLKKAIYQFSVSAAFEPIGFIFAAILLMFYYQKPAFEIAAFAAIIYLIQKMFSFMQTGQRTAQGIVEIVPYIKSVIGYGKVIIENKETDAGTHNFKFENKFEFQNIDFSYNGKAKVLSGINFEIKNGDMIGLVGSSGAGKTTLVDVILRLIKPTSGKILVDGIDLNEISMDSWRKNIGYVTQEMFLLNDTIKNNIRFYDNTISEKDIIEATKVANIYKFIEKLPNKFNTEIGERGLKISGGQRQRIVLARILARKPKILILDEATSSLDATSEKLIQEAIDKLKGKMTVIAIAHRLSTIMNSDKLLILDSGKIIEEGNPKELLERQDSHFYKLYQIRNEK